MSTSMQESPLPPYNKLEKNNGKLVSKVIYDTYTDSMNEDDYQSYQVSVLNELYRVTKPGGSFFYNHKIRWEKGRMIHPMEWITKSKWGVRQEIIWDRGIAGNIRGWRFWQVDERIYWLYKPIGNDLIGEELDSKDALMTSIWRIPPEHNSVHPAPFPVELPLRCLMAVASPGDTIIDPYSGSGTTLVAAKKLGMNYIGIDISHSYSEMALKRLDISIDEHKRMDDEISKHSVNKSYKERKESTEFTSPIDCKERLW